MSVIDVDTHWEAIKYVPGSHPLQPWLDRLPDPVDVYTTTKFADDNAAFDQETQSKVTSSSLIVIAMNTQSHHLAIRTGKRSRVTQGAAQDAVQAFAHAYGSGDYTGATIAADLRTGSLATPRPPP